MIIVRKSHDRGKSQIDWLTSYHTFSFAEYYDPQFMGFGSLRVINEDTVQPGNGFGKHPHKDMEIISYVVEGSLQHQDSLGTGSIIKPGEIQRMSAGTGILHSEFNHSQTEKLHFLQIWIIPREQGIKPSYEQKTIEKTPNKLILIASASPNSDAVTVHQNVSLYVAYLTKNHNIEYKLDNSHKAWLQVVKGEITLNNHLLNAGDGAAVFQEDLLSMRCQEDAEFLLFDLGDDNA